MPKLEDFAEYMKHGDADYHYHLHTVGKTAAEKEAALKLIVDWCNSQDRTLFDSTSLKSLHARIQATVDKFSTLVSICVGFRDAILTDTICQAKTTTNLNQIEVVGAVIYTGSDPVGHQLSSIFTGSSVMRSLVNVNQANVQQWIDKLATAIKYVEA